MLHVNFSMCISGPVLVVNLSNGGATFYPTHKDAKIFENHFNTVIVLFIGVLSDEYPCARVSIIFHSLHNFCIGQISNHQQSSVGVCISC